MASNAPKDFTFRTERTGGLAIAKNTEHVLGIMQHLLFKVKGRDDMNPDAGLSLRSKVKPVVREGTRDSDYEQAIYDQLMTYTDLIPNSIVVINEDGVYRITMAVTWMNDVYIVASGQDPDSLSVTIAAK